MCSLALGHLGEQLLHEIDKQVAENFSPRVTYAANASTAVWLDEVHGQVCKERLLARRQSTKDFHGQSDKLCTHRTENYLPLHPLMMLLL